MKFLSEKVKKTLLYSLVLVLLFVTFVQVFYFGQEVGKLVGKLNLVEEVNKAGIVGYQAGGYSLIDYMYENNATTQYKDKVCGCFYYGGNGSGNLDS